MSGGSPKTQTVTQKSEPPSWAVPYFKDAVGRAQDIADTPYSPYTGQLVADLTPDQLNSQAMIRSMAFGPSAIGAGQNYATGLLGGAGQYQGGGNPLIGNISGGGRIDAGTNKFAGSNPFLDQMIAASSRDVTDAYSKSTVPSMLAQFQQGGAFGGTAMQNAMDASQNTLAQNLGELSNQYRFQDYQTQQQMDEARLQRQAQLSDSAAARKLQASIAAANLYDQGLNRDLSAWQIDQGNRMAALGMLPVLNQAQYYGAGLLGQQGLQQQGLQQTYLDALYGQYQDARNWDVARFTPYLQGLSAVQGGSVQSTSPYQGPSAGAGALGGALSGAALMSMMGSAGGGAAGGAAAGASTGAFGGPWGMALGAGIGGLMGYFGSR